MAPLIHQLNNNDQYITKVIATGQHRELLDGVLAEFSISTDYNLNVFKKGQGLSSLTAAILTKLENLFDQDRPDLVLVHGDTTSAFSAALACFYTKIAVLHIEAGLRSKNLDSPFPEELNRQLIAKISQHHFSVNETGSNNLVHEGVNRDAITIAGNTVIESLKAMTKKRDSTLPESFKKKLLITLHRREKGEVYLKSILKTICRFLNKYPDIHAVYPLHPNPIIRNIVRGELGTLANIQLTEPLSYTVFLHEVKSSVIVLTDSGGIQEEAFYLGKPVLIAREETERHCGISRGSAHLVGNDENKLFQHLEDAFRTPCNFPEIHPVVSPSEIIVSAINQYFETE